MMEPGHDLRQHDPGLGRDQLATRRTVGRLIRAGLVVLGLVVGGAWLASRMHFRDARSTGRLVTSVPQPRAGDVHVTSIEGGVALTLQGDRILAGLSPETIARVRAELEESAAKDTSGIGGSIAQIVKKTVSANIDAQIAYPVAEVRQITYEDGGIVLHMTDGNTKRMFADSKVSGERPRFAREDAERFIAAFEQRKAGRP